MKALGFNSLKVQFFQAIGFKYQLASPYSQGLIDDSEWKALDATLERPLPVTFRLNTSDPRSESIAARLRELSRAPVPLVAPLAW